MPEPTNFHGSGASFPLLIFGRSIVPQQPSWQSQRVAILTVPPPEQPRH
jgi:hypothetical protein